MKSLKPLPTAAQCRQKPQPYKVYRYAPTKPTVKVEDTRTPEQRAKAKREVMKVLLIATIAGMEEQK